MKKIYLLILILFVGFVYSIKEIKISIPKKLKNFTTIIGNNTALFAPQNDSGNFTNQLFLKAIDTLGLKIIRFPGGTFANFFNWDTMTMDEDFINIIKKKNMINLTKRQRKLNNGKLW